MMCEPQKVQRFYPNGELMFWCQFSLPLTYGAEVFTTMAISWLFHASARKLHRKNKFSQQPFTNSTTIHCRFYCLPEPRLKHWKYEIWYWVCKMGCESPLFMDLYLDTLSPLLSPCLTESVPQRYLLLGGQLCSTMRRVDFPTRAYQENRRNLLFLYFAIIAKNKNKKLKDVFITMESNPKIKFKGSWYPRYCDILFGIS